MAGMDMQFIPRNGIGRHLQLALKAIGMNNRTAAIGGQFFWGPPYPLVFPGGKLLFPDTHGPMNAFLANASSFRGGLAR